MAAARALGSKGDMSPEHPATESGHPDLFPEELEAPEAAPRDVRGPEGPAFEAAFQLL